MSDYTQEPIDAPPESERRPAAEPKPELLKLGDLLTPAIEVAERRASGKERPVPLAFPGYAEMLGGGLWPGVHPIVAGTGVGKSAKSLANALHAAKQGVPVLYVGLELGEVATSLRVLGDETGLAWSRYYTGRTSERHIADAREAALRLKDLPFYCEFGPPNGWPPGNMIDRVEAMRREHPSGPLLVVLDFLQIVGNDPTPDGRQPDLRESIKRASYVGQYLGNKYGASVVLISSAARDKYALLASTADGAGLTVTDSGRRTILNPDMLLGLGKESGEIEYASESQTVLLRWPKPLDNGEKLIVAAVPKLRYGPPGWIALSFNGHRFTELGDFMPSDFPCVPKGKGRVSGDEYEQRVLDAVRNHSGLKTKNEIIAATKGARDRILEAIGNLSNGGQLVTGPDGFSVRD